MCLSLNDSRNGIHPHKQAAPTTAALSHATNVSHGNATKNKISRAVGNWSMVEVLRREDRVVKSSRGNANPRPRGLRKAKEFQIESAVQISLRTLTAPQRLVWRFVTDMGNPKDEYQNSGCHPWELRCRTSPTCSGVSRCGGNMLESCFQLHLKPTGQGNPRRLHKARDWRQTAACSER